jgi:phosphomannomutase
MAPLRTLKTGISGVRGVVGDSFTPQLLIGFAQAFGTYLSGGTVLIGRDTRPSGEMALNALVGGLLATGCSVIDVGIAPVPTIQHAVRRNGAAGGIAITASHNPQEWNALKFVHRDGILLRPHQAQELLAVYYQGNFNLADSSGLGSFATDERAVAAHLADILDLIGEDRALIAARHFKVVVDCCNGAGATISEHFLRELGCEVIALNNVPDGLFPHRPEPIPENLGQLCQVVREQKPDLGFAQDADADRLAIVDETGEPVGEEFTLAFACDALPQSLAGPLVTNLSTSRLIDEAAARQGREVRRTAVGEINVVEGMQRFRAALGGEGNGGVIWPRLQFCRDSFVAMAFVLAGLARRGGTVAQWTASFRPSVMIKEKVACSASAVQPILMAMREEYAAERVDMTEGVRVTWDDGSWVHIRPSNTEPIIRVISEADDEPAAREKAQRALQVLRQVND